MEKLLWKSSVVIAWCANDVQFQLAMHDKILKKVNYQRKQSDGLSLVLNFVWASIAWNAMVLEQEIWLLEPNRSTNWTRALLMVEREPSVF